MYLPNSTKAAEFLCHEEVMQTLAYAQENKNNLPMIQEILAKARLQKGLTHREASVLLACPSETVWEELYQLAEAIKLDYYGKRIVLFAPCGRFLGTGYMFQFQRHAISGNFRL